MQRYQERTDRELDLDSAVFLISRSKWDDIRSKVQIRPECAIVVPKNQFEFLKMKKLFKNVLIATVPPVNFDKIKDSSFPLICGYIYCNDKHHNLMRAFLRQYYGGAVTSPEDGENQLLTLVKYRSSKLDTSLLLSDLSSDASSNTTDESKPMVTSHYNSAIDKLNTLRNESASSVNRPIVKESRSIANLPEIEFGTSGNSKFLEYSVSINDYNRDHIVKWTLIRRVPSDENMDDTHRVQSRLLKPLGKWIYNKNEKLKYAEYGSVISADSVQPCMDNMYKPDVLDWYSGSISVLIDVIEDHLSAQLAYTVKVLPFIRSVAESRDVNQIAILPMGSDTLSIQSSTRRIIINGIYADFDEIKNMLWMVGDGWMKFGLRDYQNVQLRVWFKAACIVICR
ncbi:MAG: P8, partial [Corcyphos virus 3]